MNLSSLQIGKSYTSQAFGTHMVVSFIMLKPEPFNKFIVETSLFSIINNTHLHRERLSMVYEPEKNEGRKPQKKRKKEENIISLAVF